jgi:hypothetical protein
MLAATSIATSRIMLSIHSLASKLGSDTGWLLNHAELSRMKYRNGAHEGELIIERYSVESDDFGDVEKASALTVKTSHVGMF